MNNHDTFIQAIHQMKIIEVTFRSDEKGVLKRRCIPFDYGPSKRAKDNLDRYHTLDLDSPDKPHNLSLLPEKIIEITYTSETFDPANYVSWRTNWHIARDWGALS